LYGLTMYALTRSTIATAATIVTAQSTTTLIGSGRRRVSRSIGFREWWRGRSGGAVGSPLSLRSGRGGSSAGVVGQPPLSSSTEAGSSGSTGPGSGGGRGVDTSGSGEEPGPRSWTSLSGRS
jgi:hypothetical protein